MFRKILNSKKDIRLLVATFFLLILSVSFGNSCISLHNHADIHQNDVEIYPFSLQGPVKSRSIWVSPEYELKRKPMDTTSLPSLSFEYGRGGRLLSIKHAGTDFYYSDKREVLEEIHYEYGKDGKIKRAEKRRNNRDEKESRVYQYQPNETLWIDVTTVKAEPSEPPYRLVRELRPLGYKEIRYLQDGTISWEIKVEWSETCRPTYVYALLGEYGVFESRLDEVSSNTVYKYDDSEKDASIGYEVLERDKWGNVTEWVQGKVVPHFNEERISPVNHYVQHIEYFED